MSVSRITDEGYRCLLSKTDAQVLDPSGKCVATLVRDGGLYVATMRLKRPVPDAEVGKQPAPFGRQDP